jgi:acetyl/propionyl-CoA carboxylase alpha subunit
MFEKILVANRGEVAARVARTCRRIGADTVAVHVEGEEDAVHVQACDAWVRVGPPRDPAGGASAGVPVSASYADVGALIGAARESGCAALHPGYGLLDDDPMLSRGCEKAGIAFVGPSPEELVLFRDRVSVRNAAFDAGLRILPGSERPIREPSELREDAESVGYPLVLKPAFGIGEPSALVVIESAEDLEAAIARTDWDGAAHYAERHVDRPRHVEVQLVGDGEGSAIVVGDREVSVRKDHRRVLAESPTPAIDALRRGDAVRSAIWAAAIDFALYLRFRGVGSAHFLLDARGSFHFLSFHPALQAEHAVIELCANVDLVEVQVRLANREPMPSEAVRAEPTGHAVQARIEAATNPGDGRPFGGRADEVRWPPAPTGKVRIETGIQARSRVQPDHDPLVATVTTYAPTRHEAVLTLDRIIAETRIAPLVTNLRLLRRALNHESFRASQYDEGFLDRVAAMP